MCALSLLPALLLLGSVFAEEEEAKKESDLGIVTRDRAMEASGGNKRLSVERIYQKKSQLEHILLRPDTYIGSVQVGTLGMLLF